MSLQILCHFHATSMPLESNNNTYNQQAHLGPPGCGERAVAFSLQVSTFTACYLESTMFTVCNYYFKVSKYFVMQDNQELPYTSDQPGGPAAEAEPVESAGPRRGVAAC